MKRFITLSAKDAKEILVIIRNTSIGAITGAATKDAYDWLKKQIAQKRLAHHDQNAASHTQLPHRGGYASFYVESGRWMYIEH